MALKVEMAGRLGALMQRVGYALWQLQVLEDVVAAHVVVRLRAARGVGAERGKEISAEVLRKPLGALIAELAKAGVVAHDLAARLKPLLDDRNWLVHRSRRESHGALSDNETYATLSTRLRQIADRALALSKDLGAELEEYVVESGVSRDFINQEAGRLARSWWLNE